MLRKFPASPSLHRTIPRLTAGVFLFLSFALIGAAPHRAADVSPPMPAAETLRQELLLLVNGERLNAGLQPVQLDDLANRVGERHARELAEGGYLSHWSRNGWKPYMRYSFAGGTDAMAENVARLSGMTVSGNPRIREYLREMHISMHDEKPPHDGHRRTILRPEHTHVGFGFAAYGSELRLTEEFLSRYVEMEPPPQTARPKDTVTLKGRILDAKYVLMNIQTFYEPTPETLSLDWLRRSGSYGLPDTSQILKPLLSDGRMYEDYTKGEISLSSKGRFQAPVKLFMDGPGVYTVVVWIAEKKAQRPFPATNICIAAK
jgi:uncharacterized protein YkwD